jgi:flap endonuclease-1
MGIKNLLKFLSEHPDIIKEQDHKEYYGKKIAIDISILMYQVVIAIRNSGSDLTNNKGEVTSHILGLFNKTLSFLEKGIIPVFVFDGKPPHLKYKILEARKQVRQKALEKLSDAQTSIDKIKYLKRSVWISREQMNQCRELLTLMGIPYINAPQEADSQLAYLCKQNMVYAVLTEDMDILTFGSPRISRNLTSSKKAPLEIELSKILEILNITYDEFIELCILFGCDYCPTLSDIKTNDIFTFYMKNKSIEKTLHALKEAGYNIPDKFEYIEAKEYFKKSLAINVTNEHISITQPEIDQLINLLVGKYGLIKYKIIGKLTRLNDLYNKFKNT